MKELSIEEKAKRYDEVYKKVAIRFGSNVADEIFPELAESEDEKIRKALISVLKSDFENDTTIHDISVGDIIAWLEKQSEPKEYTFKSLPRLLDMIEPTSKAKAYCQKLIDTLVNEGYSADKIDLNYSNKPADKIEPKFRNGQWIVWQDKCYKVNYNGCGYELVDQNGLSTSLEYGTIDENAHFWDISDAKDGDVLFIGIDSSTCIFKKLEGNLLYSHIIPDGKLLVEDSYFYYEPSDNVYPATKEQRDLLFQKMHEAGYEWDAEKKELKKIEQKPAWSEEDEKMCQETIDWFEKICFPYALESENPARESIKWLNSLKDRLK